MTTRFAAVLSVIGAPLLVHCGDAAAPSAPRSTQPHAPRDIAELAEDALRFVGVVITLEGAFHGFEVSACRFAPTVRAAALSRRDWLFRTGTECVFVTGGRPTEFEDFDPSIVGRPLELKAQVEKDERGLLILRYLESRWIRG